MSTVTKPFLFLTRTLSFLGMTAILLGALALLGATVPAAFGILPWLSLPLTFGETVVPEAGMYVQIGVTALMVALLGFLPNSARVNLLESSHRKFELSMNDVARAYHHVHHADRAGVFTLSSEFDEVRDRLAFLRDHPDLERVQSDVLEVAAQMGQQSKELAAIYSNEKVARAKAFLSERQANAERVQEQIVEALQTSNDIRRWTEQVEVEEAVVESQLGRLREILEATLPGTGYRIVEDAPEFDESLADNDRVIRMKGVAAE